MHIRILNINDNLEQYLDCVKDLMNASLEVMSVSDIKETLSLRPANILTFVGVDDDNNILATATIIMEKKLRYRRLCCHIEDVGVREVYRNKGYGKDIVEYCIKVAKENKCYKIKLNCTDKLVPFYQQLGFDHTGNHMTIA